MQTGRSFFVVECSIKSVTKIYAKILSFACILWIIAARWYYFNILPDNTARFPRFITRDFTQLIRGRKSYAIGAFLYWVESIIERSKESLYKTIWPPIILFLCIILLFHWISKRVKEGINAPAFVPREDFKLRTEVADVEKNMRTD